MPAKDMVKAIGITEDNLQPHLRKKIVGSSSSIFQSSNIEQSATIINVKLDEEVGQFNPIHIKSNGLGIKANQNNKACHCVALQSGIKDDIIKAIVSGVITTNNSYTSGQTIYLGDNILTATPSITNGLFLQIIATALLSNMINIHIEIEEIIK